MKAIIDFEPLRTACRRLTANPSGSGVGNTEETTRLRLPFLLALAVLAACGGGDLLLPKDGEPARIVALRGDSQTATVGEPLPDSLVVKVTDPTDRPVADVEVVFVPPAG